MKVTDQILGLEKAKLFGFEHLAAAGWDDTETAIGVAHNKRGIQGEGPTVSDRRLKTNVTSAGVAENGLPLYDFCYLGSDRVFRGLMAQDIVADGRHSDAVETRQGFYCIDYERLGLGHLVSPEMCAAGARALSSACQL